MADLGQIFTNSNVAEFMVSLFDFPNQAKILDPCFGAGVFLDALLKEGFDNITACEMDTALFEAASPKYKECYLQNIDFLKFPGSSQFDGVIMNPPYIRQEKINELKQYGITKKQLHKNPIFSGLPTTANMYMYFILKAIYLLNNNGQLVVIFPSSWMNSKSGVKFKNTILLHCDIERQVHIYGDVFERSVLVDVVILKLVKGKKCIEKTEEFLESKDGKILS